MLGLGRQKTVRRVAFQEKAGTKDNTEEEWAENFPVGTQFLSGH